MAKRRHAVALFEVIHKDKRFADRGSLSLRTPSWWFKGQSTGGAGAELPDPLPANRSSALGRSSTTTRIMPSTPRTLPSSPRQTPGAGSLLGVPPAGNPLSADETTTPSESAPDAPASPIAQTEGDGACETSLSASARGAEASPAAVSSDAGDSWPTMPEATRFAPLDTGPRTGRSRSNNGTITPTSAAIIGAALVLVLIVGIKMTRSPQHASAGSTPTPSASASQSPAATGGVDAGAPAAQYRAQGDPSPLIAQENSRQAGADYALINLYANQSSADKACDFLEKYGVPCTVEHDLKEVQPQFYAVVGLKPITRTGTPETASYLQKIKTAMQKLQGNSRTFKVRPIRWDGQG